MNLMNCVNLHVWFKAGETTKVVCFRIALSAHGWFFMTCCNLALHFAGWLDCHGDKGPPKAASPVWNKFLFLCLALARCRRNKNGLLTRHPLFTLGFQCCFACVCLLFLLGLLPWLFCCLGELCQIPEKKRSKGFGNQGSQKRQRLQQGTKGCCMHTCCSLQLLCFFCCPRVICRLRLAVTSWQWQWLTYRSLKE